LSTANSQARQAQVITETWCERWNIKVEEEEDQARNFPHRIRLVEAHLVLNEQIINFVNHATYLG
jgi:hypothetical protein